MLGISLSNLICKPGTAREKAREAARSRVDKFNIDEDVLYAAAREDEPPFLRFLRCMIGLGPKKPPPAPPGWKLDAKAKRKLLTPYMLKQLVSAMHYPFSTFPLKRLVADLNNGRGKTARRILGQLGLSIGERALFNVFRAVGGMWPEGDPPADEMGSQDLLFLFPDNVQWQRAGSQVAPTLVFLLLRWQGQPAARR